MGTRKRRLSVTLGDEEMNTVRTMAKTMRMSSMSKAVASCVRVCCNQYNRNNGIPMDDRAFLDSMFEAYSREDDEQ